MKIWKDPVTVEQLNHTQTPNIHSSLGIQFVKIGNDFLEATMPVDERTKNPIGILHGGASVVLAESLGSVASILVAGSETQTCFGIEISASHLQTISSGKVLGRVKPIRLGKTLHVWDIQTFDFDKLTRMLCQVRLTVMVKDKPKN